MALPEIITVNDNFESYHTDIQQNQKNNYVLKNLLSLYWNS